MKKKHVGALAVLLCAGAMAAEWMLNPIYTPYDDVSERLTGHKLVEGKLVMEFRRETRFKVIPSRPPKIEVWREIYAASNGVVVLEATQRAKYSPPVTRTEPESVEWPK